MYDPDAELVRQAKAGDKAAFGKLVTAYFEMAYVICYGVLNHAESARDATQEAFLKAYRELHRFEGKAKFKTWLYRIAVNTAIDLARKRRPTESLDTPHEGAETVPQGRIVADRAPGPREEASRRELRARLEKALYELSAEHRAVLVLREWQGLSYEEIAEVLGIQIGTVMSRLFYARKKMAEILKDLKET